MNHEEKILEAIAQLKSGMDESIAQLRSEMETRFDKVETRLGKVETRLGKVESDVAGVRVLVDVDIEKNLNLLAEGHQTLLETLTPKTKTEELEENDILLRMAVAALSKDVAELKKAQ